MKEQGCAAEHPSVPPSSLRCHRGPQTLSTHLSSGRDPHSHISIRGPSLAPLGSSLSQGARGAVPGVAPGTHQALPTHHERGPWRAESEKIRVQTHRFLTGVALP